MRKDALEKWREIYFYVSCIAEYDPWKRFKETDIFALLPKGKQEEHFFSFLFDSSGQPGIAIYWSGHDCFNAQERLHGSNPKKEPVFLLQDAIIMLLGNREDVSKENYALLKELGIKCRGRCAWPHFEKYRVGYAPKAVEDEDLDKLLDDMGNLWMMLRAVYEENLNPDFTNQKALTRCFSEKDDLYYTYVADLKQPKKAVYTTITMQDNERMKQLRKTPAKGAVSLDWAYLPIKMREGKTKIIPRLLLAVDTRSGVVMHFDMLSPSNQPFDDLFEFFDDIVERNGKPALVEICDKEMESYLSDLCRKAGIPLAMRKRLPQLAQARSVLINSMLEDH